VMAEIEQCVRDFGLRYIGFKDDIFGTKTEWAEQFAEAMIARGHDLRYGVLLSPFSYLGRREPTLRLMKRSGLDQVVVGIQSADPEVIRNIKRRPEQLEAAVELVSTAKRQGITTIIEFIFGLPGDSDATMRKALDYSLRLRPHHALFFVLTVLEGSEIFEQYGAEGPDTGFTLEQLRRRCSGYQRHFYTRPGVFFGNLWQILRTNPRWFLRVLRYLPYLIKAIGMKRSASAKAMPPE